ncbi:Fanconi anemia group J -like protein [Trichinella nativa]|uniref:DNA 5'-3' helicase n=1 Tax=Trichinella nativa TaxID=6335 RepID=A0A0V1LJR9_9BILA|nr:Fanconi anemia group J -like protein [Trichinella nativa]
MNLAVGGANISFPFSPYPSQRAIMDRTLRALKHSNNCLIESPTGTGKSLALLCSALAWQKKFLESMDDMKIDKSPQPQSCKVMTNCTSNFEDSFEDSNDFSSPPRKKYSNNVCKMDLYESSFENEYCLDGAQNDGPCLKNKSCPKIFYAARTHKQLAQMVRELKKTHYQNVKMTIMASREFTCLNPNVCQEVDKSAACQKLLLNNKNGRCIFMRNLKKYDRNISGLRKLLYCSIKHKSLEETTDSGFAWDIEDIMQLGECHTICPYFACIDILARDAQLIFCPYNYLIDPMIRNTLQISLKGQIIIFDEAHNMEDICREASSFEIKKMELDMAINILTLLAKKSDFVNEVAKPFVSYAKNIVDWIERESIIKNMTVQSEGLYTKIWTGADMYVQLQSMGLQRESIDELKTVLSCLLELDSNSSQGTAKHRIINDDKLLNCIKPMEKLLYALDYLYRDFDNYGEKNFGCYSYRMCLRKERLELLKSDSKNLRVLKNVHTNFTMVDSINFWCMNPAVAFDDVSSKTKSVILASGTLSPLKSYATELGLPFQFSLEAPHVVPPERMWIGSIGVGPNDIPLKATFQQAESFAFQDELASLLTNVCNVVPGGILCFIPSYRLLNKLVNRWKQVPGLWDRLNDCKQVIVEPKGSEHLESALTSFYYAIEHSAEINSKCTGALLLAVYRGKISEGIDFSDNSARAVIAVGIPFPNLKNIQVQLKKQYNNTRLKNAVGLGVQHSLISGDEWLEIQAYRALNQALGRCLRHKMDWGALLLVDSRFNQSKHFSGLSTWIRRNLYHYSKFSEMLNSLQEFSKKFVSINS